MNTFSRRLPSVSVDSSEYKLVVDTLTLLRQEEMDGERLVNKVRLTWAIFNLVVLILNSQDQTRSALLVWSIVEVLFALFGFFILILLRDPSCYYKNLKYI